MNLGFSTQWPKHLPENLAGKPTCFVEKIYASLYNYKEPEEWQQKLFEGYNIRFWDECTERGFLVDNFFKPKKHTIRDDENNRWKEGNDIHFVVNQRTKNHFQFAPVTKCVSTQRIVITEMLMTQTAFCTVVNNKIYKVEVDDRILHNSEVEALAVNDGFENARDFFSWFNKDFTGKIIHWTNLKY